MPHSVFWFACLLVLLMGFTLVRGLARCGVHDASMMRPLSSLLLFCALHLLLPPTCVL